MRSLTAVADLGTDWARENDKVIIGGDWLTGFGINEAGQLKIAAVQGV